MAVVKWTAGTGFWSDGADWSGGSVPGAADTALFEAAGDYTVAINAPLSVYAIVINNYGTDGDNGTTLDLESTGGTVSVATNITISGELGVDEGSGQSGSTLVVGGAINLVAGYFDVGPDNGASGTPGTTTVTAAAINNYANAATGTFGTIQINSNPSGTHSVVDVTGNFYNAGFVYVDEFSGGGGSNVSIGGTLTNDHFLQIGPGNDDLTANTTVSTGSLINNGTIELFGGSGGGATGQALLDITAMAPSVLTGVYELNDNSLLEFASGQITAIDGTLYLYGAGSGTGFYPYIADAGSTTSNSALTGLTTVAGTFYLDGGELVKISAGLTNSGDLEIDQNSGSGGSTLSVGGTLTNTDHIVVGATNDYLLASTTLQAAGLVNSGEIDLDGGGVSGSTSQALVDITSAAPSVLTGTYKLNDNSLLEFASGQITAIDGTLYLYGAGSGTGFYPYIADAGSTTSNSALTGLTTVAGIFYLDGGELVKITAGLTNSGDLEIDQNSGSGGSTLSVGGTLTNTDHIVVGATNDYLLASTTLQAAGLVNSGEIDLDGGGVSGSTSQALVDITSAAPSVLTGTYKLNDNSLLEFASGQITAIDGTLYLYGAGSGTGFYPYIADAGSTTSNSALTGLTTVAGIFYLDGGELVKITAGLTNSGDLEIDQNSGSGGSTLSVGGTLTNTDHIVVGATNDYLLASTTLQAAGLVNSGEIDLDGGGVSGSTSQALVDITSAAPSVLTGTYKLNDNSLLEFASGQITAIDGTLYLYGAGSGTGFYPYIADAGSTTSNSALTGLTTVAGIFYLDGGELVKITAGLTNSGDLEIDQNSGSGGSTLSVGGTLTNTDHIVVGATNDYLLASTTLQAAGLVNSGEIDLDGGGVSGSTGLSLLSVAGTAANTGTIKLIDNSELQVTGAGIFDQNAGVTTVGGVIAATTININGGLLDFTAALTSGDGTGALNIGADGTLEFGAAVDASHTATFTAATGTLELGSPASFAGTISGFSGSDVIDLTGEVITGLSWAGSGGFLSSSGQLTVSWSGGSAILELDNGEYTALGFTSVSDGASGSDILLTLSNPVVTWASATTGSWTTASNWTGDSVPNSSNNAVIAAAGGYTVSLTSATSVNSVDVTNPGTTLSIAAPSQTVSVAANFSNAGVLEFDDPGTGGTSVSIGGVLTNDGTMYIGNGGLSAATVVSASAIDNTGTLNVQGNNSGGTTATLYINGAAGFGSAGVETGNINLYGDGQIEFASGVITTIAEGATLNIQTGIGFVADVGSTGSNSALTGLAANAGNLDLSYGAVIDTSAANFTNIGTTDLDDYAGSPGGSQLSIAGILTNDGIIYLGGGSITKQTQITASGLVNEGTLNVQGNNGGGTQGLLDITTSAGFGQAGVVTGIVNLYGDGQIEFASGQITTVADGATLNIQTGIGYVADAPALGSNSALTSLASNTGNLDLSYNAVIDTSASNFWNAGTINLDNYAGSPGGSKLSIAGTLTNDGLMYIGAGGITAATLVTAAGLVNTGTLDVQGNNGGGTTGTLDISAAAGFGQTGVVTGVVNVYGDGLVEFASGQLTAIADGATLNIQTGIGFVADAGKLTSNSALTTLASNDGNLDLSFNAVLDTSAANFYNGGTINVDNYAGSPGGSQLSIAGVLTNDGTMYVGAGGITTATVVDVAGLINNGYLAVQGNNLGGTTGILDIASAAGFGANGVVTGNVNVFGDGLIEFASGQITEIGFNSILNIQTGIGYVADAGSLNSNSALTALSLNDDIFDLSFGAVVTTSVGTNFLNDGSVNIDDYAGSPGGSKLSIGGIFTNYGTVYVGTPGESQASTLDAAGLINYGTINLYGDSTAGGTIGLTGAGFNYNALNINADASVTDTGVFTQAAGTAVVYGSLSAAAIDVTGGLIEGNGTLVGAVDNTGGTILDFAPSTGQPATLTISGSYAQSAVGVLEDVLAGTGAGQAGLLAVTGDLALQGGALLIDEYNGFTLAAGQTFTVATFAAGTEAGLFGALELAQGDYVGNGTYVDIGGGLTIGAEYNLNAGNIEIEVFTTPTTTADNWLGGPGNWSTAADWSTGAVPMPDSDVTIGQTGTGAVTLDTAATIDSLAITNGNSLSFAASESLVIGGGLTISAGGALNVTGGNDVMQVGGSVLDDGTMTIDPADVAVYGNFTVGSGGILDVDSGSSPGGSTLTIDGTLFVSGTLNIGNGGLGSATTVTAASLDNTGLIDIIGGSQPQQQATLDIETAAPSTWTGSLSLGGGYAVLEYAGGGIQSIASGGEIALYGGNEALTVSGGTGNSLLDGLASNAGELLLGDALPVVTSVGLVNTGEIVLDPSPGFGGSTLAIGGVLTNSGSVVIGNSGMSFADAVSATGLNNSGTMTIAGNSSGSGGLAELVVSGAGTDTGSITLRGDAVLIVTGGLTVSSGGTVTVSAGATANDLVLISGGIETVSAGGTASGTIVSSGGSATVFGRDVNAGLRGGTETVSSGGIASGATVSTGTLVVANGGTASGTTVSSSGHLTVSSGGLASSALIASGGTELVLAGGTASGTVVSTGGSAGIAGRDVGAQLRGGTETVSSGGVASSTTVSTGTLTVSNGGAASSTTVSNGGTETVYGRAIGTVLQGGTETVSSGGVASSTTVSSGKLIVAANGLASGTLVVSGFGGTMTVLSGGVASSTTIGSQAGETISAGGLDVGATITYNGKQFDYGTASATTIDNGGAQIIEAGGTASGTTVISGGIETVSAGGTASGTIVSSGGSATVFGRDVNAGLRGGTETVSSGGIASGATVSTGTLVVANGGTASGTTVSSSGHLTVSSGGLASSALIASGGTELVLAGGTASGTVVSTGGSAGIAGRDVGAQLRGGTETVSSGGVASSTTVSTGTLTVSNGGAASSTTVSNGGTETVYGRAIGTVLQGGTETVSSGGVASSTTVSSGKLIVAANGLASGTLVVSGFGGTMTVLSGGVASSTTIGSQAGETISAGGLDVGATITYNGKQFDYGTASATTIDNGGAQIIEAGGTASGTTVISGGIETVSAGGTASGTIVSSGGSATVFGRDVNAGLRGGTETVSSGGIASGATVSTGTLVVANGGTASGTTVSSSGHLTVSSGGLASSALIASGGTELVLAGGTASGTVVSTGGSAGIAGRDVGAQLRGGTETVSSGGVASSTTVSTGTLTVSNGGAASSTTVSNGGTETVYGRAIGTVLQGGTETVSSGGVASSTTVSSGKLIVAANGLASGTLVVSGFGGTMTVLSGGVASSTTIGSQAGETISAGGLDVGATITYNGKQFDYGTASATTIDNGGAQIIEAGGTASGTTVISGGIETVSAGGTASGTIVSSGGSATVFGRDVNAGLRGGTETVSSGGIASGATVSTGTLVVANGGTASGTTVSSSGHLTVSSGGLASSALIASGGTELVLAGGTASGTVVSTGGSAGIAGRDVGAQLRGGTETVSSGGVASSTTVSTGTLTVSNGGAASSTTVSNGGTETVYGRAIGTVLQGGTETVSSGGVASSTTVSSGKLIVAANGLASGTLVVSGFGGTMTVLSGGVASSTTIGSQAGETISAGGLDVGATITYNGKQFDYGTASATTIDNGGAQIIEAGGTASGTTVISGGIETVSAGGVGSNVTISGGFVEIVSGGSIGGATGTITFAGGGELQLDASASFNGQIGGFGGTDKLDLHDIQYISGTTTFSFTEAGSNTSGTLTVTDGTHTAQLTLLGTYTTSNFAAGSDGHGGTLITDPPGGGMMTFVDLDPHQMTTIAAGQPDASGNAQQDETAVIGSAYAGTPTIYPGAEPSSLGVSGGYHIPLPPGS